MAREVMVNYENGSSPNTIWVGESELDGEKVYIVKWSSGPLKKGEFFKVLTPQQFEAMPDATDVRSHASKVSFS